MSAESAEDIRLRLIDMHWNRKQSLHQMASNLGIDRRSLVRLMTRLSVPRRSYSDAMALRSNTKWVTKDLLENLYWGQRLSISRIAIQLGLSSATIFSLLKRNSITRRTTSEAGMKFAKHHFLGEPLEASYLLGFRTGDLHACIDGSQIRLSTSSTHPAMSRLLTTLFLPYGRVGKSPAVSNGRWGWLNYCYLDPSFKFLLKKPQGIPQEIVDQELRFLAFFAGYFDAEGNLRISQDEKRAAYYLRINSEDETILRQAAHALRAMGYHAYFRLLTRPSAKNHYKKSLWSFGMFRKQEVLDLLPKLPLLHDEKIRWKALMLESREEGWDSLKSKTIALRSSIKAEVRRYCELARAAKELAADR